LFGSSLASLFRSAEEKKESCSREEAHIWSSQHETEASEQRDGEREREMENMDGIN